MYTIHTKDDNHISRFDRTRGSSRIVSLVCAVLVMTCAILYASPICARGDVTWPYAITALDSEGGIVFDADSGTVIYGKNIHEKFFPASITKILTALIIIENCDMNDKVTFSQNAVYNVESGSSNMGMDTGDVLTVRDCLYGLLLQSANESANALAEHMSGSIEAFCEVMNERARELGCVDSNFANPSGLNNPNHVTSAYDMALISQAAFDNKVFVQIDSALSYRLPATKRQPDGRLLSPHHRMLKKNDSVYYPGIIGGKTGYTSLAGNTLVTCAERDGMRLIAVVLNGQQSHYRDTKILLDFGFENFRTIPVSGIADSFVPVPNDMTIAGLTTTNLSSIQIDDTAVITVPKTSDYSGIDTTLEFYDQNDSWNKEIIGRLSFRYNGRFIGDTPVLLKEINPTVIPASDPFYPTVVPVTAEASGAGTSGQTGTSGQNGAVGQPEAVGQTEAVATDQGTVVEPIGGSSDPDSRVDSPSGTVRDGSEPGFAPNGSLTGAAGPDATGGTLSPTAAGGVTAITGTEGASGADPSKSGATAAPGGSVTTGDKTGDDKEGFGLGRIIAIIVGVIVVALAAAILYILLERRKEERRRQERHRRRMAQLGDGISAQEYELQLAMRMQSSRMRHMGKKRGPLDGILDALRTLFRR
ncbi:MAG: serine hydrolase [Lachnospiraceae bacterium]|nr:serine hydrolase [Lachnospiraceae bacterium]